MDLKEMFRKCSSCAKEEVILVTFNIQRDFDHRAPKDHRADQKILYHCLAEVCAVRALTKNAYFNKYRWWVHRMWKHGWYGLKRESSFNSCLHMHSQPSGKTAMHQHISWATPQGIWSSTSQAKFTTFTAWLFLKISLSLSLSSYWHDQLNIYCTMIDDLGISTCLSLNPCQWLSHI